MQIKSKHNILSYYTVFLIIMVIGCGSSIDAPTPNPDGSGELTPPPNQYTDSQIIEMVQKDALKYFWDYAHPNSKLARERYHTDDPENDANIVTTGGSGFGLMSILVGIHRGYLNRSEAVSRLQTALSFLENADRFHGAWGHWMNGNTGAVIPFSTIDNGGDLVETSFLCQGLICIREYFKNSTDASELAISYKADQLWKGVEWNWYTKGENALYWHWSPNYGWQINFKLEGYNECLITYVLGASSPTYPIAANCINAWNRNGALATTSSFYQVPVVVKHNGNEGRVGPMFWAHYSHLGLDPRGLSQGGINYWSVNKNHAQAMYNYCVANPLGWKGYSNKCWGLTASYTRNVNGTTGYRVHQPKNGDDTGIISPTAAISNLPYTPEESMNFLRYLYNEKKEKFVGVCGPFDAISPHYDDWKTPRYLAIDQGTIVPMIANAQDGFLWNLFMNAPDVRQGLIKMGFQSTQYGF